MQRRIGFILGLLVLALAVPGCRRGPSAPSFDVPSLIGQDIDAVTAKLGKPSSEENQSSMPVKTWKRDGTTLSVSYKPVSKRVTTFVLISRDDANAVREEGKASLFQAGKLPETDPRYSTELIEAGERTLFYTGIRILPVPKTHVVLLRVTGASALLEVNYQTPSGGDRFMTLAPWEKSFNVPDDARVLIASRIFRSMGAASFWMKTEIVVDGKVVVESKSTGIPVSCEWEL